MNIEDKILKRLADIEDQILESTDENHTRVSNIVINKCVGTSFKTIFFRFTHVNDRFNKRSNQKNHDNAPFCIFLKKQM